MGEWGMELGVAGNADEWGYTVYSIQTPYSASVFFGLGRLKMIIAQTRHNKLI